MIVVTPSCLIPLCSYIPKGLARVGILTERLLLHFLSLSMLSCFDFDNLLTLKALPLGQTLSSCPCCAPSQ